LIENFSSKAKLYFQFGRCQTAGRLSSNEQQQMKIFNIENKSDLAMIRFWQKGLSEAYRKQIRALTRDINHPQPSS
jgi:hypothetical protein